MTNFSFLAVEWPEVHEAACKTESLAHIDPRTACFQARRALELAVHWMYRNDAGLSFPYQEQLSALIHEPSFRHLVGQAIFTKAKVLKDLGNDAVHSTKPIPEGDALTAVRELFHVCFWLVRTYARGAKPAPGLTFDTNLLPRTSPVPRQTVAQLQTLARQIEERDEKLTAILADKTVLDEQVKQLQAEVAQAKAANQAQPDTHDYSEAETRDFFIDRLLNEAGWPLDQPRDREYEVSGMPNQAGVGYVDYVLWGGNGKPLAVVEAKRTKRDAQVGQQQAKLYADCLEQHFGQRPVIFYSNGYEHWMWDDAMYPPRAVQGFLKRDELELLIQRRASRFPLSTAEISLAIADRYYQRRAILRVGEAFEKDRERKSLLVMATGAGKTRTVIALADVLMRCNWAKRVLFLADRVALVNQAVNAFKRFLPASSPVNLVTEKNTEGRIYVSTYPTMVRLIDEARNDQRQFGIGHFDLIIIDEAHRSVYQKYGAIFEYFDSLLVGLTATPKDEVDRNTYGLFELEDGVPTDSYGLDDAVRDGNLVPPQPVSVPLRFQRDGINYDQLSEDEKEQWDALEWGDDGQVPTRVDPESVNKWLFNKDTVDKVLEHLMTRGQKVAGGDRLGKTIIFAKNHDHAMFIAQRFDANYPSYQGSFARVIDFQADYAQSLIDDFSKAEQAPHIAISVDMLDTGIDIPEVVNLVFFKMVRSRTKFWQMVGRGTRLRPDLFGPGQPKEFFYIFDYCGNLEFFGQNPDTVDGALGQSLGSRLFLTRLELIAELDSKWPKKESVVQEDSKTPEQELRREVARLLQELVACMNVDNFIVRPRRRLVEKYSEADAWAELSLNDFQELAQQVAGLPSDKKDEDEEAKRFDLLMLRLQLSLLRTEPWFMRLQQQVRAIASKLEDKGSIPMVQTHLALIQALQTDEYWQGVTAPMLDQVRKNLRSLIKFMDKGERVIVYTDFVDRIGTETTVELPGFGEGTNFERFRAKARQYLRAHEDHIVLLKLRLNEPLTQTDLQELERMLLTAGLGTAGDVEKAKEMSKGLGLFVRSLVGLDRATAKEAFGQFLVGKTPSANQINFLNLIIDHLTQHGTMEPRLLYESPYTDISPQGPQGVFTQSEVQEMVHTLKEIQQRAVA